MNILLTGGSSHTGYWIAKSLKEAGHNVVATLRGHRDSYTGIRGKRVQLLDEYARIIWRCSFGSDRFLRVLAEENCEILAHHAATTENYRSSEFDLTNALENNTYRLQEVLQHFCERGGQAVVLTGSVFEPNEGCGSGYPNLRAFSPYGLSKGLTYEVFKYWADTINVPLGKFVIPNPFGPYEEEKFTDYLLNKWSAGQTAAINTPGYVRDNIHVDLLSKAYVKFVDQILLPGPVLKCSPSGYVESQGAFAIRFSEEIGKRLSLGCEVELCTQIDFPEPMIRINHEACSARDIDWQESSAWDNLAQYYSSKFLS